MKVSKAQEKVMTLMSDNEGPFHFIPWGLNYYHLQDGDYNYLGRVRFCTFDALAEKSLITSNGEGWELI